MMAHLINSEMALLGVDSGYLIVMMAENYLPLPSLPERKK